MASKTGLRGAGKFRRLLRSLPEECRAELVGELQRAGPVLLAAARAEAPDRTGASSAALAFKVFPKTLRLQVGLLTKAVARRFFYLRILETGRRAQTVQRRGRSGNRHPYRVSPISPSQYDIVRGRTRALARRLLRQTLNDSFDRALRRASSGGGD